LEEVTACKLCWNEAALCTFQGISVELMFPKLHDFEVFDLNFVFDVLTSLNALRIARILR
jgi:hypothetical protein